MMNCGLSRWLNLPERLNTSEVRSGSVLRAPVSPGQESAVYLGLSGRSKESPSEEMEDWASSRWGESASREPTLTGVGAGLGVTVGAGLGAGEEGLEVWL